MKILHLTPWFPSQRSDQQGNFILDSVEALADLGNEVTVLVTQPWRPKVAGLFNKAWRSKKIFPGQYSNKLTVHVSRHLSIPRSYFCSLTHFHYRMRINRVLKRVAQQCKAQLIHAHTELPGVSAVDVGRQLCIPTVITLHGISTEPKLYLGNTKKTLFNYTLKNANRVVLVGDPLVNFAKQFVDDSSHFRVVGNGFRALRQSENNKKKLGLDNYFRFVSVSNLEEGKGIDINLYALAKLNQKGIKSWDYKVIGDGSERSKLELIAKRLNLHDQVKFLGACSHNEVYDQLAQSDVFILPSYREAFGVAYLEAMSHGLLTVGVQAQGPEAFIKNGVTGFLVSPRDVDSLVDVLAKVFLCKNTIMNIADEGKKYVVNYFTWQQHAKKLEDIYQELF